MKEFDYERAKAGDPVCTRDGRDARIICWDIKCSGYTLAVAITGKDGEEAVYFYPIDGKINTCAVDSKIDLFMKPIKRTYWVNVYRGNDEELWCGDLLYKSNDIAISKIYKGRRHIGTYPIEIEE